MAVINYDHPQAGMEQAMRSLFGQDNVAVFDFYRMQRSGLGKGEINRQFLATASDFRPDWVWLQVQDSDILSADSILSLKERFPGAVVTHWTGDLRPSVSPYLASFCRVADMTLISSVGQIPLFQDAGARKVRYCQIAVDWDDDVVGRPYRESGIRAADVMFCGNFYGDRFPGTKDRLEAIETLHQAGIDVGVVGTGWPSHIPVLGNCHVKEQFHVYRRSKVALSINHFNDVMRYYSDRQLISMASGVAVVCRYVPGLEEEFANGEEVCWYREPAELLTEVRRLLASELERVELGRRGRAAVVRRHTWWNRYLELLPEIEALQANLEAKTQESLRSPARVGDPPPSPVVVSAP